MKKMINSDESVIVFKFTNGNEFVFDPNTVSEEVRNYAMFHGFAQKLGDNAAGAKEACSDGSMEPEDWREQMVKEMAAQLASEGWNRQSREGGGAVSLLQQALVALGIDEAKVVERLKGLDKEQKKALTNNPEVAAQIAVIKAERAAKAAEKAAAKAEDSEPSDLGELFS